MLQEILATPLFGGGGGEAATVEGGVPVGAVGEPLGVVPLAATTVIDSFIPWAQWPDVGHMKYIGPAVVKVIVVLPPL